MTCAWLKGSLGVDEFSNEADPGRLNYRGGGMKFDPVWNRTTSVQRTNAQKALPTIGVNIKAILSA